MTNFDIASWAQLPRLDIDIELAKKSNYLQSFHEIILALNTGASFEEIIRLLLTNLMELTQEENTYITIINHEHQHLEYIGGTGLWEKSIGFAQSAFDGMNGEVWEKVQPVYIQDYQSYERRISVQEFASVRSVIVFPLIIKDEKIGTLGFAAKHIKLFDTVSLDLLNNFVQLASSTLNNALLQNQFKEKNSQFETLHTISLNTINHLDATELYNSLLSELIELLNFGQAFLDLVDTENDTLYCVADTLQSTAQGKTVTRGEGLAGKVWETKEAIYIEDYQSYSEKINIAPIKVKSIACIPLKRDNEVIGVLGVASEEHFKFDDTFKFTVQAFAEIASIAIINSKTFHDLELKTKESELLEQTQKVIASKLDLAELCQSVTASITTIFDYSSALIVKVEDKELLQLSSSGSSTSIIQNNLIEKLIETRSPQLMTEVIEVSETTEGKTLSHLVCPLIINGGFFGFLYLSNTTKAFIKRDETIMLKVCKQLEVAIENAKLHGQIKKDLVRTEAFYKVSKTIQTHRNLDDIATDIVEICREALAARWAVIYRIDQPTKTVKAHARAQIPGEKPLKILDYTSLMDSFTGWVMRQQESVITDNIVTDDKGHQKAKRLVDDIGSAIIVPLIYQGKSLGSLGLVNKVSDKNFSHNDLMLAENVANQAAVAIVQHEVSHQLEHQAYHDTLTKLPNRAFFEEKLELSLQTAIENNTLMAVMFLDLDGFKHVNDTLGHDIGDALLKIVAQRLKTRTRKNDTIARLGGDEFGIIISKLQSKEETFNIAQTLLNCFKEPFSVKSHSLQISTSIGISLFPEDGQDAQTLLKYSDSAMYAAKTSGKNNIRKFIPEFAIAAKKRLEIELDLNKALQEKEFKLYYQPKLSLATGDWLGAEALIRWNHPDKGFISPGDFIPIAEEGELIIDINNWVLDEACRQAAEWRLKNHPELSIAVNISALHFEHPTFIPTIEATLEKYKLDARLLELEVTESVVMRDIDLVIERLSHLKSIGTTIAVDDFGTGYSSLQYLNKLPLDTLKIDKSFIDEISESSQTPIVTGILTLAQSLGLETVAEGVETIEQVEFLKLLGCSQVQGFYFAKPMPAESFWNHYYKTVKEDPPLANIA